MIDIDLIYLLYQNERTMVSITMEAFISLIEAVRLQTLKDRSNAITLAEMFNSDGMNPYDNSILIKAIVSHLQTHFPKKDNHCEIEHYMFDMNFGKVGEDTVITIEHLWYQLNKNFEPLVSTHQMIDQFEDFKSFNSSLTPEAIKKSWLLLDEAGQWDRTLIKKAHTVQDIITYAETRIKEITAQRRDPEIKAKKLILNNIQGRFHAFEEILKEFK